MILKRLTLYNFRPFFEEQQILFATNDDKRVTLVHAENGVGKTSLLSAILWCFYGRMVEGVEQPDVILNHEAAAAGYDEYSVSLRFEYEGNEYEACRKGFHKKSSVLQVFEVSSQGWVPINTPESFINGVVPSSMANYFFFHGEGNIGAKGKDIKTAIRDILGFSFAETAIMDLEAIESGLRKEVNRQSKDPTLMELNSKIDARSEELAKLKEKKKSIVGKNQLLDREKKELDSRLEGVKETRRLQEERLRCEEKIKRLEAELEGLFSEEVKFIRDDAWTLFSDAVIKKGLSFIDESEMQGKFPSPYYETFIQDLLDRERCICGEPLEDRSSRRAYVRKLLASSGTPSLIDRVSGARSKLNEIGIIRERAPQGWRSLRKEIRSIQQDIQKRKEDRKRLSEKISDSRNSEASEIEERREEVDTELFNSAVLLSNLDRQMAKLAEEKQTFSQKAKVAVSKDKQLSNLRLRLETIEATKAIIVDTLDNAEERAAEEIQTRMTELMTRISRKDYSPVLDINEQRLYMTSNKGEVIGASTGERLLLNFVFISTLIETCRHRASEDSEILIPGAIAPFVIDAPFGELDDTYKTETAKFLPERARQVILFLSTSHWKGRIEQELEPHIGAEYLLVSKRRQGDSDVRQKDLISIRGRQVAQSVYGCDADMTEVMEVDW